MYEKIWRRYSKALLTVSEYIRIEKFAIHIYAITILLVDINNNEAIHFYICTHQLCVTNLQWTHYARSYTNSVGHIYVCMHDSLSRTDCLLSNKTVK